MKNWNWILGTFVVLTIIGLFLPFLITQKPWFWDLGSSDANEIGDAIGGILGPYFSFIGSCLLAYTIYFQIKTRNEDKQKDYEKVIFKEVIDNLNWVVSTTRSKSEIDGLKKEANEYFSIKKLENSIFSFHLINIINCLRLSIKSLDDEIAYLELVQGKIYDFEQIQAFDGLGSFRVGDGIFKNFKSLYAGKKRLEFQNLKNYFCLYARLLKKIKEKSKDIQRYDIDFELNFLNDCNKIFEQFQPFFNQFTAILPGEKEFVTPISSDKFDKFVGCYLEYKQKLNQNFDNAILNHNHKATKSSTNSEENNELTKKINELKDVFNENCIDILPFFPNFEENLKS